MKRNNNKLIRQYLMTVLFFFSLLTATGQPTLPQRTITVNATQPIHFGTFCVTGAGGGTVTVGWDGTRTATGSVVLLSIAPTAQPAVFEVKLCQGRNVTISYDPTTIITGSNGGSLIMDIGPTERGFDGAVFTTDSDCNFVTPLRVGGTLHIPVNAIPGIYTGNFNINFTQQ
jgi:hypothetical protein